MTTLESAGGDQDLWHVEVAPDDVRPVTLDQLDEAFQQGLITESTRVWQEGLPCAMTLGELLGGDDEDEAAVQPVAQQYAEYAEPQYVASRPPQAQYAEPQFTAPQYAAPQYAPPRSAPPPSRAPESSWPPVVARSESPPPLSSYVPPASYAPPMSTPAPPSMAPMALDVPDYDIQYPRSGGKGKFVLAAFVVAAAAGAVAFQQNGGFGASSTPTVAAAAVQAPPPPSQPASHAYDPGPPVKLGESKPPLALTVREEPKADDKKAEASKVDDKKIEPKKTMASGKRPAPAVHSRRSAPAAKAGPSNFKLGKGGSKYDPLNGSI